MTTTGNLKSLELLQQEVDALLPRLTNLEALEIGEIAKKIGLERNLPIAIQVQIGQWIVFKAALPGSKPENDSWIARKANVVNLKEHLKKIEIRYSEKHLKKLLLLN